MKSVKKVNIDQPMFWTGKSQHAAADLSKATVVTIKQLRRAVRRLERAEKRALSWREKFDKLKGRK